MSLFFPRSRFGILSFASSLIALALYLGMYLWAYSARGEGAVSAGFFFALLFWKLVFVVHGAGILFGIVGLLKRKQKDNLSLTGILANSLMVSLFVGWWYFTIWNPPYNTRFNHVTVAPNNQQPPIPRDRWTNDHWAAFLLAAQFPKDVEGRIRTFCISNKKSGREAVVFYVEQMASKGWIEDAILRFSHHIHRTSEDIEKGRKVLFPHLQFSRYVLASLYNKIGKSGEATAQLTTIASLSPDNVYLNPGAVPSKKELTDYWYNFELNFNRYQGYFNPRTGSIY